MTARQFIAFEVQLKGLQHNNFHRDYYTFVLIPLYPVLVSQTIEYFAPFLFFTVVQIKTALTTHNNKSLCNCMKNYWETTLALENI